MHVMLTTKRLMIMETVNGLSRPAAAPWGDENRSEKIEVVVWFYRSPRWAVLDEYNSREKRVMKAGQWPSCSKGTECIQLRRRT